VAKRDIPLAQALRLIAHGPVTLIATESRGIPNLAACARAMPVADRPPTIAVSLAASSLTRRNLEERGEFALSIPGRILAPETHYCGLVSGRDARKERETRLRLEPAGRVRAPHVVACIGHLECRVLEARPVGESVLYLAEVVLAIADETLFDETWNTDDERARALHHLGGNAYTSDARRVLIEPHRTIDWRG
jgi:flavin reductase (DIM6/NTAB) family NADH-FMN oxidoreductase RutF